MAIKQKTIVAPNIYIKDAYLEYAGTVLFKQLNMTLNAGKFTCLLGPSGVGKTTLLRMIAHLIPLSDAEHETFRGIISNDSHVPLTKQIAYLPQQDSLLPWLTAIDNTLLGARLRGDMEQALRLRAEQLFTELGLSDAINKYPRQLSGGMRQRVTLIRTLLEDKPVILMDEPFSAVDAITRFQLQTLAVQMLANRTVLLVTHDPMEALRMADEIYILSGQPAHLQLAAHLTSPTPRDPADKEFMHYQAILFHLLTQAKENSV